MSNKFLGATNAGNLADGTVLIYASSLGASGLNPSYPVKTNSLRQLVSSKLNISDINNLQDTLDNVLTNPFADVDTRLSAVETKTQNQTATALTTTFAPGTTLVCETLKPNVIKCSEIDTVALNGSMTIGSHSGDMFLGRATKNMTIYNDLLTTNAVNSTTIYAPNAYADNIWVDKVDTNTVYPLNIGTENASIITLGKAGQNTVVNSNLLIGTSQSNTDIFNNGSSLTKNNFNTSQSVGCIGFKDNWNTATGNNASIKQSMVYMSNVGRVIVVSNSTLQYFDDATGALINCIGGLTTTSQVYVYIPSLGLVYGRTLTQYTTSSDGINFSTPQNILGDIGVNSFPKMIYGNGLYITSGGSGSNLIQTSTDGITWTNRASTRNIFSIIYTGSRFITFGASGCMYSTDGLTWINDTVQLNNIRAVIYCDTLGCILAQIYGGNRNIIRSYDSGLTWTTLTDVFPFNVSTQKMLWDSVSGKAYYMADEPNNTYIYNSFVFEFDASGNPALGGSIQMMGNTSASSANTGIADYIYNPSIKRFLFTRNISTHPVFYSTTSNNLAVSGNQYIIGSLNCSGGYNPYGLANIDIMLRDTPFIGIQYQNSSGLNTTFSNSLWNAMGSSSSVGSVYALTNNFTRQLCAANWTTTALADGAHCGYASTNITGARVSTGFNFGLSAVLGISDSVYNSNNCQNFWGLWNLSTQVGLTQAIQLSTRTNMICFGSDTNDANICIYTAGASSTVKQVDLGASFPSNRPSGALSTDWFKFSLYWDTSKFYYKAVNTTTDVVVSGTFTALVADIPAIGISLFPQCVRVMGTPQANGQARLQVQRFGVYY